MSRTLRRIGLLVITVFAIVVLVSASTEDIPTDRVAWLEENVIPIETCEAENGFEDLAPLAKLIGDARIVGLGESTHGTREHFQMKHRLVEYLVEELDFSWFAIEASTPEAHRLNDYVLGGDGDPVELIRGMYFWTWTTEEVLAMVEWMRAYNARSDHKIHFTGFDMQTPDVALEKVIHFLRETESPLADRVENLSPEVVNFTPSVPSGIASYHFPTSQALGKIVRFSAWVKTQDVLNGHAGLWWNVYGPNGVLASANMIDRGVSGTTDWTQCVIELPVPAESTYIHYGFYIVGNGSAWFDSTAIELNGIPFDASSFDLDFEKVGIAAFSKYGSVSLDRTTAHTGLQSLRISGTQPDLKIHRLLTEAEALLAEMQTSRESWLAIHPAEQVERALLNARIVVQYLDMLVAGPPYHVRDVYMAENVTWLTEQFPEERIILWAHNAHISRSAVRMGAHLADRFGDTYLPIGFATSSGQYSALKDRYPPQINELQEPPAESFEAHFAAVDKPIFALDLREASNEEVGSAWLTKTRAFRFIGSHATDEQFIPTPLRDHFDLIIFIEETTAARQL